MKRTALVFVLVLMVVVGVGFWYTPVNVVLDHKTPRGEQGNTAPVKKAARQIETVFSLPGDLSIVEKVIALIRQAQPGSNIYLSYYKIAFPSVLQALEDAHKKGVRITMVLDDNHENDRIRERMRTICASDHEQCIHTCSGACVDPDPRGKGIMHNKFMLFSHLRDGRRHVVLQSSSNLYPRSSLRFQDAVVVYDDKALYTRYLDYFHTLYREEGTETHSVYRRPERAVQPLFSPSKAGDDFVQHLLDDVRCGEQTHIHVAEAYFYDDRKNIAEKLRQLSLSGCDVKVITGVRWKRHHYVSPGYHVMELLQHDLVKYQSGLHTKFILIDAFMNGKRKKVVLAGSHNLTRNAMYLNDETLLYIEDDHVYDRYLDFWHRIERYSSATTQKRTQKVQAHHREERELRDRQKDGTF